MGSNNAYQAYVEGTVLSGNPLEMVIALYEGALVAVGQAKNCLEAGDIWGRSKAISKAVKILTELLVSLDHTRGAEISANLKRLYSYMQCRLLDAHAQKSEEYLTEVERLLLKMLEGWRGAADRMIVATHNSFNNVPVELSENSLPAHAVLAGTFGEDLAPSSCVSALF